MLKVILWLLVSRQHADVYTVHGGGTIHTAGCTITARLMRAYVDNSRNKPFLVFVDENGEEEGRCAIAKPIAKPIAKKH